MNISLVVMYISLIVMTISLIYMTISLVEQKFLAQKLDLEGGNPSKSFHNSKKADLDGRGASNALSSSGLQR